MINILQHYANPANLLLFVFIFGAGLLMFKLQRRKDFDWAQLVMDEKGFVSAGRFLALGAFMVTSWVVMTMAMGNTLQEAFGLGYLAAWSGTMIASKAVDAYATKGVSDVQRDKDLSDTGRDCDNSGGRDRSVRVRRSSSNVSESADEGTRLVGVGRERL